MKRTTLRLTLAASAFVLAILANLAMPAPAASAQCWKCRFQGGAIGCGLAATGGWTQCADDCVFSGSQC